MKTMPKEQLSGGIVGCQTEGWMTNEIMKDSLLVVGSRRSGGLWRKWGCSSWMH